MKAQYKLLTLMLMLLGSITAAQAADRFFVDPLLVEAGKSATINFQLENDTPFYGFQTEVTLPSGLTLKEISLDDSRTDSSYDMITNVEDGKHLIAVFSNDHLPIKGNSSTLMKMEVDVASDFTGGYLNIYNSIFVSENNKDVPVPDSSTYIGLYIPVTQITLNRSSVELKVGEEISLIETIYPENATDKSVNWTSSNPAIATVDDNGHVTALALGETIVSVTCGSVSAICKVTVVPTLVSSITLDPTSAEIEVGESFELTATVLPDDATDKTVVWNSTNSDIATVNSNGKVTGISPGEVNITATCDDVSAICKVTVFIPEPPVIPAAGINLNPSSAELEVAQSLTLIATVIPEDATDKTVTWTSSDSNIASVDQNGNVTALALGTATITASCGEVSATCAITVVPTPVTAISLTNTTLTMKVNKTAELLAIVRPDNATDKSVTWSSDNEAIVTVDQNGIVTSWAVGTAIITVTSVSNPEVTAQCFVTVETDIIPVREITVVPSSLDLIEGDTYKLQATVGPEDATDKSVTWRSSDRAIATVAEDGTVTAIAAGNAIIYASSSNGLTAECLVTVSPLVIPVASITLSNSELLMTEGETTDLIAIIRPENATDKSVIWTSSDESIVTVDQNGNVNAIKAGNAIVTATATNGSQAICYVTVVPLVIAVESISVYPATLDIEIGESATLTASITPENATDKTITWRSSDKSIATVSSDGIVTGIAEGIAIIYASSSNGLTAECIVNVHPGVVEVLSISLSNSELLMREGYTAELFAIIRPENATDKSVVWTSSNESIVTVDQNGLVTAIKQGIAIVTATASNGAKDICTVTVVPAAIGVESISLNRDDLELEIEETFGLIATILPDDATDKSVTWRSSDFTIATVNENGVVTGVSAGTATIYASSSNGLTAECLVTVKPGIVEVLSIALSNYELLMIEGDTADLIAIVRPDNATDKSVIWTSSDDNIATVDQNGSVSAIKVGLTTVTATAANGVKAECAVTVMPRIIAVAGIYLSEDEINLIEEDTFQLTATILPEDATDKTVTWRSSDREIATVDENGLVTAVRRGTAIIYASSSNGLTAECRVNVSPKTIEVISISLDKYFLDLYEGESEIVTAIITPDNATDKTVFWTSSNPSVATVEDGVVTGVNPGAVTITATASNGKSAYCRVVVYGRPFTPKQLLKKGDGTTSTFVTLMGIPDAELTQLGYRYVVGYTTADGQSAIIAETPLRYCHTIPEIFNDPSLDFWVFAVYENAEGVTVNSNLRHLDGSEEICYNTSKFGYATKGSDISAVGIMESDEWIEITPTAMRVATNGNQMKVDIYTSTGMAVCSSHFNGGSSEIEEISFESFAAGIYVVKINCSGKVITKKFVIR